MHNPIINIIQKSLTTFWIHKAYFCLSRLRDGEKLTLTPDHYEGGTIDQPTLMIKNSTRHDQGAYTCELRNKVGSQESNSAVYVAIYCKLRRFVFFGRTYWQYSDISVLTFCFLVELKYSLPLLASTYEGALYKFITDTNAYSSRYFNIFAFYIWDRFSRKIVTILQFLYLH
jgi:hypothetical protein